MEQIDTNYFLPKPLLATCLSSISGPDFPSPLLFPLVVLVHSSLFFCFGTFYLIVSPHCWLFSRPFHSYFQPHLAAAIIFLFHEFYFPPYHAQVGSHAYIFISHNSIFAWLAYFLANMLYIWTYIIIMDWPNCFRSHSPPPFVSKAGLITIFLLVTYLYSTCWLMF
jgi:hypothetical protein